MNQLRTLAVVGVAWVGLWCGVKAAIGQPYQDSITPRPVAAQNCGPLPGLGTTSVLDSGEIQRTNVRHGTLTIQNDQSVTVVALLGDATLARRYQAITVGPNREVHVQMPTGHYGLGIMSGHVWCNLDRGFTDGTNHFITGGVTIKAVTVMQASVGTGASPGQISVRYREWHQEDETTLGARVAAPQVPWPATAPSLSVQAHTAPLAGVLETNPALSLACGTLLLGAAAGGCWIVRNRRRPAATRRKSLKDYYYNPKEFRTEHPAPPPIAHTANAPQSRLLLACGGDHARVTRLMEYERRKEPYITNAETARRALERLERDRE